MNKKYFLIIISLIFLNTPLFAADQFDSTDPTEQAREDYRAYLQQLRVLNRQYKQVTGEIKKVLQEEGVPSWDENTGELSVVAFKDSPPAPQGTFGDVDIEETEKEMIVRADMPGVKKDKIRVKVQDGKILHISGERDGARQAGAQNQNYSYAVSERQHGRFERAIELPSQALDEGIEARYEDGVLMVWIPKAASSKKEVNVSIR